jgi:ATP-binding cassette subfamily B protein
LTIKQHKIIILEVRGGRAMKYYKESIKKYWYCFLLGPIFMVMEASGEFILPYLNANIINIGIANKNIDYVIMNGIYMALIALMMLITGVLGAYFAIKGASSLTKDVRNLLFKKIQTFSFTNIDDFSTGSLITRITNDMTQIQTFTQTLLRGFFRSPVMLIGAIVMSFILNKQLAFILTIAVIILAISIATIIYLASPRYMIMQKQLDTLNNNINEVIINERVIKSFVREDYETKKFKGINEDLMNKTIYALNLMIAMQPMSTLAINVTTLAVVFVAGKQIIIGNIELGTLTAFITYLTQILSALSFLANIFLQGTRALTSHYRIKEVLETTVDLNDNNSHQDLEIKQGNIEFKNVTFRYFKQNNRPVLNHINLIIDSGETVGIIGSTGAGKTTLVSMIPRLYDVDEGSVFIDGKNVKDYTLYHLRENVAMVLQNNTLFSGTIEENLRWGNELSSDKELQEACYIAKADEFVEKFPRKYQSYVEQGGNNLSGGQKQRLTIARALLKKPKILILDDSTSAVDTSTDAHIRKELRNKLKDTTKIIITQRVDSIIDADKIIVLENGKIEGIGKHQDLIQTCKAYQEIYYSQKDKENV